MPIDSTMAIPQQFAPADNLIRHKKGGGSASPAVSPQYQPAIVGIRLPTGILLFGFGGFLFQENLQFAWTK